MSANNLLIISRKTYEVRETDAETGTGHTIGKPATLQGAIDMAMAYQKEHEVEYGLRFVGKWKKERVKI